MKHQRNIINSGLKIEGTKFTKGEQKRNKKEQKNIFAKRTKKEQKGTFLQNAKGRRM